MSNPVIVVHYHEAWLKGRNRRFFLRKLSTALRQSLQGISIDRIEKPGDRFVVSLGDGASQQEAIARVERVLGIAFYALARTVERNMEAICRAAWEEIEPLSFVNFAVRAKRSDKSFPQTSLEAVSYTHLDVYKRQRLFAVIPTSSFIAVSNGRWRILT